MIDFFFVGDLMNEMKKFIRETRVFNLIIFICFLCVTGITFAPAYASGDPGPTIDPTVEVGNITWEGGTQSISDVDVTGSADVTVVGDFCVYSNVLAVPATDTTPSFKLTADAGTGFLLSEAGDFAGALTATIPYTVSLTNGLTTTTSITEGIQTGNLKLSAFPSDTCSEGLADNVGITVTMTAANIASVPAGPYSQTITLSVAAPTVT